MHTGAVNVQALSPMYVVPLCSTPRAATTGLSSPVTAADALHGGHVELLGRGEAHQVVHLDGHLQHGLRLRHRVSLPRSDIRK